MYRFKTRFKTRPNAFHSFEYERAQLFRKLWQMMFAPVFMLRCVQFYTIKRK